MVKSRQRRSGHVMLEMALGFFPFFGLIFGIADFSMVMTINSTLQNAVTMGVREGITYNLVYNNVTYTSQTALVQAVVQANSGGWLTAANTPTYVSVSYYAPGALSTAVVATYDGNGNITNAPNAPGNVMEVKVRGYPWNWLLPLPNIMPGLGMTLNSSALDVLQSLPVGVFTAPNP